MRLSPRHGIGLLWAASCWGIAMLSYSVGPTLGNVESGLVAAATTVRTSVVSGGIACVVVGGVLAITLPALRHYRAPSP